MELTITDLREGDRVRLRVKRIKNPVVATFRSKTLDGRYWLVGDDGNHYLRENEIEEIEFAKADPERMQEVGRERYRRELAERTLAAPLGGFDRVAADRYVALNRILLADSLEEAQRIATAALELVDDKLRTRLTDDE